MSQPIAAINSHQVEEIKKKSLLGASSFFIRTVLLQGIGFVAAIALSRFFSPSDFGIYGLVIQIIGVLTFFSDIGLAAALIQKNDHPTLADLRSAFTAQFILSWFIFVVIVGVLLTGVVQAKTGSAGVWVLLAFGLSFPLATLKTIPSILLERKLDFSQLVIPQLFEQVVFYSILIYCAAKGLGAFSYAYAIIARSIVGAVVMWIIQPWQIGLQLNAVALKGLLVFGVQFQANDFLARIKDQLFFLLLGLVLPLDLFGYIQWAKNWSLYPYNLTVQNIIAITFPTFSRMQSDTALIRAAVEKSIYVIAAAIFPVLIVMSLFAFPLTVIFPEYAKWQPALLSLAFFNANVALSAITNPILNALNAVGKISITLKLMIFWVILTWAVTPLFVLWLGYTGVSVAAFVVAASSLIVVKIGKKLFGISFFKNVYKQLLAAAIMSVYIGIGSERWSESLYLLVFGMLSSTLLYAAIFYTLDRKKINAELSSLFRKR